MADDWKCPPDRFPVMGPNYSRVGEVRLTVPQACVLEHEAQAQRNHGQSVARLKERGGLAWAELAAVLWDRKYHRMDLDAAHASAMTKVLVWEQERRKAALATPDSLKGDAK